MSINYIFEVNGVLNWDQICQFSVFGRLRAIVPLQSARTGCVWIHAVVLDHLALLAVDEGVADYHFFINQISREALALE